MTSSIINRAPINSATYCFNCQHNGTIVRTDVLGIDYGVEVVTDDNQRHLFCGTTLRDKCEQINAFVAALQTLGDSPEQVEAFREAWHANTEREVQRQQLYNDLLAAQASGTTAAYLASVKVLLQVSP